MSSDKIICNGLLLLIYSVQMIFHIYLEYNEARLNLYESTENDA